MARGSQFNINQVLVSLSLSLSLSLSSFDVVLVGVVYFCLLVLVVLKETKGLMVAPLIIFHTTMYASPT
jgi:uncharacterized protein (DUF983 family)